MGAYRWLSDNYKENDRIYLFGFSRGAYQVRALAGMIQRVGLIHKGNEEQIPFAYELYATRTSDPATPPNDLATRFKVTFSREKVHVHFVGVWDTVSSVGIVRGKTLPLTDSADHVCFFRHALALDERRVKFLPEYVHGGASAGESGATHSTTSISRTVTVDASGNDAQAGQTCSPGPPRIKEVWFPGTHSDIGGGNQPNVDLNLGRTPFLWMSFEAVSSGMRLQPSEVEWPWDKLDEVKESLTSVWWVLEWIPFFIKRLSYKDPKDPAATTHRWHRGRGRKVMPGQKLHSSIAFCPNGYHPKAILKLSQPRHWNKLVAQGRQADTNWEKGWEGDLEMDIFDYSLMSDVLNKLQSGPEGEEIMWIYRLTVMTSTDEGRQKLLQLRDAKNDLVQIFTSSRPPVQECVMDVLEKLSKRSAGNLSEDNRRWLLRVAREQDAINVKIFAVKFLAHTLFEDQSFDGIVDEDMFNALAVMVGDKQQSWVADGTLQILPKLLHGERCVQYLGLF
ncbi:hypothetical protein BDZ97DRAFT_1831829 [Flammula alnicola]|nr:hypothetical protein BDZ97DRAFT_1831829 [Flammula alnicola]